MSALPQPERSAVTDTLAAWQAREAELRALQLRSGLGRPEQFAGRSGIEIFQAMLRGEIPVPPISETLDFQLVEAEPGRVQFQGRPQFAHYNPLGSVHGGWIATLLDSAVACAVHTLLPAGKTYTTLELKVNYLRAMSRDTGPVRAEGTVLHSGSRTALAEGRLLDSGGRLLAHATTTCMIMRPMGGG